MVKSKAQDATQRNAEPSYSKGAFPTATFVVGIGDLGGDVLHQLAERWTWVANDDPDDETLGQFSLLHLRCNGNNAAWEEDEEFEQRMAMKEGVGEDPELALNLLILRTLGLIRIHDGRWQIASPVDDGAVRLDSLSSEDTVGEEGNTSDYAGSPAPPLPGAKPRKSDLLTRSEWRKIVEAMSLYVEPIDLKGDGGEARAWHAQHAHGGVFAGHRIFRRRYFQWLHLAQDPMVAASKIASKMRSDGQLAQFIEPLLARVRVGNSPQVLLHALRRRTAWEKGRDPSPWRWLGKQDELRASASVMKRCDALVFGRGFDNSETRTPTLFQYQDGDVHCPIEPWVLLSLDWGSPGWTFLEHSSERQVFRPLPNSPHAFGFFDHDERSEVPLEGHEFDEEAWGQHTAQRMKELAVQAHRGLVRLWGELTRQRRLGEREADDEKDGDTGRAATLRQSLELLGEFVVRDVAGVPLEEAHIALLKPTERKSTEAKRTQKDWSLDLAIPSKSDAVRPSMERLDDRLRALGVSVETKEVHRPTIFETIDVHANSFTSELASGETRVRAWINREVRGVFEEERLGRLPRLPGDMPVYARVFIVGDLGEASVRRLAQPVLRSIHAELRRSVYPIFDGRFDGHTRPLTVNPYFSMPHPADTTAERMIAGEAEQPSELMREFASATRNVRERVIVDALHGVRRWMELVPEKERLAFELLVSGRVTDRAVMTHDDAIEEMRAFIWMNARNVVADDDLLNQILTNKNSDILSTVAFRELSFPAERARVWLSNRLSRGMLRVFTREPDEGVQLRGQGIQRRLADLSLPTADEGLRLARSDYASAATPLSKAVQANKEACEKLARDIKESIEDLEVDWKTDAEELLRDSFSRARREELIEIPIHDHWRKWVKAGGDFDDAMVDVRRRIAREIGEGRREVILIADELVEQDCVEHGLLYMKSGFEALKSQSRSYVSESEKERQTTEKLVREHRVPDPSALTDAAWEQLRETIKKKPDEKPLWLGAISISIALTHVLNSVVSVFVAQAMNRTLPDTFTAFDPLDPPWLMERGLEVLIFAILILLTMTMRKKWLQKATKDIEEAREAVGEAASEAVKGRSVQSLAPFFDVRLRHRWEVARKGHAQFTWNRVAYDDRKAGRIAAAVETRGKLLRAEVESYGVRVQTRDDGFDVDEPSRLFRTRVGTERPWLVSPETVGAWYKKRTRDDALIEVRGHLNDYFNAQRPLENWRDEAPFSDGSLLAFTRDEWAGLIGEAVISNDAIFRDEAQENIGAFVARHFGSMGYGVKFRGYEGFDEDGIDDSELQLLVPQSFRNELESTLSGGHGAAQLHELSDDRRGMLERVEKSYVDLRPNAIFLMMVALGVRERSFRNIQRYDSFYERKKLPESERFPFSGSGSLQAENSARTPLNQFSHHRLIPAPSVASGGEKS